MSYNSYPIPKGDAEFEQLSLEFLREEWARPALQLYAKRGSKQHGVDIVDLTQPADICAAQCKRHEVHKALTPAELKDEATKTDGFPHSIRRYAIITTARKSKAADDAVLTLNVVRAAEDKCPIELIYWDAIEAAFDKDDLLKEKHLAASHASVRAVIKQELADVARAQDIRDATNTVVGAVAASRADQQLDTAKRLIDTNQLAAGEVILNELRARECDRLGPLQRFRLLTNLGVIEAHKGNIVAGGRLMIQAVEAYPEHERAGINRAHGEFLIGNLDKAWTAAIEAHANAPDNANIVASYVRYAPEHIAIEDLITSAGDALREPDVLVALADKCLTRRDLHRAKEMINRLVALKGDTGQSLFLRAALLTLARLPDDPRDSVDEPEAREDLRTALLLLDNAAQRAEQEADNMLAARARLVQLDVARRLDDGAAFDRALDEGARLGRVDVEAARMFNIARAQAYGERGMHGRAVESAEKAAAAAPGNAEATVFHAVAMWNRNSGDDRAEARVNLTGVLEKLSGPMLEQAGEVLVHDAIARAAFDDARAQLERLRTLGLDASAVLAWEATTEDRRGNKEEATRLALASFAALRDVSSRSTRRRAAAVLRRTGAIEQALQVLRALAPKTALTEDTRSLLALAVEAKRHDVVLEWGEPLWFARALDEPMTWHFLGTLEEYNAPRALELVSRRIGDESDAGRLANLKIRRVHLEHRLGRPVSAVTMADVPSVGDVDIHYVGPTVDALMKSGLEEEAVQYAYRSVLRFPNDPNTHANLIRCVLCAPEGTLPHDAPAAVAVGCTVEFREDGDTTSRFRTIQPSAVLGLPDVIAETEPLAKALLKQEVGASVTLAHGAAGSRTAKVLSIQYGWRFRFNDSMREWQLKFPEVPLLEQFRVDNDPSTGKPDPAPFVRMLQARAEAVRKADNVYKSGAIPIAFLGDRVGRDVFETMGHLAFDEGLFINCVEASDAVLGEAIERLREAKGLVMDGTAIWTMFQLGADLVANMPIPVGTVQQSLDAMRGEMSPPFDQRARMTVVLEAGKLIARETSASEGEAIQARWRAMTEAISKHGVYTSDPLATLSGDDREKLDSYAGAWTAHAIAAAKREGFLLWSDDRVVDFLAKEYCDVRRVWTQAVLAWLRDDNHITVQQYREASARLRMLQYSGVGTDHEIIVVAARLAEWKLASLMFSRNLTVLGAPTTEPAVAVRMALALVRACMLDVRMPASRALILIATAEQLQKRDPSLQLVAALTRSLPREMRLMPLAVREAAGVFVTWMGTQPIVAAAGD